MRHWRLVVGNRVEGGQRSWCPLVGGGGGEGEVAFDGGKDVWELWASPQEWQGVRSHSMGSPVCLSVAEAREGDK